jgi:RNA polymerase sigma-70 factor (ECF subfamily)
MSDPSLEFEPHRRRLTGLAYRLLGSRAEADDVVQDAYLRWHLVDRREVEDAGRYLGRVVTRLCLDRAKSARARREVYVGPWLPEPVVDEAFDESDAAHDLSVALMMALERLSPLERASFLLHDVFDLDFTEIARALDRNEAACRQLAARARQRLRAERPRFPASREESERLAVAFREASQTGDAAALAKILAQDAVLYTDGGGKRAAAINPIFGADKILRFFEGINRKAGVLSRLRPRPVSINGLAGFLLEEDDGSVSTIALEIEAERITRIYIVRNPDKLTHLQGNGRVAPWSI